MAELRTRVVALDAPRLAAIDPRDDSEVWVRALSEQRLPTQLSGEPGSPQALIAQLYAGAWAMAELEPVISRGRVPVKLTFVGPAWTWAIPVMVWVLAFLISLIGDSVEERLLTFARVWGAAFWAALAFLGWMAWLNVKARRAQRQDAALATARRAEEVEALMATRDRLLGMAFVAQLPKHVLVHDPLRVALREQLRRAGPAEQPALLARRDALEAEVQALVVRMQAPDAPAWLPIAGEASG
ncbi:MAG: hypothetical protein H6741_31730 [Alphaproteobacteria bacterium]|nr:hypothetical protein [Alphaproteobacteria bacterium]